LTPIISREVIKLVRKLDVETKRQLSSENRSPSLNRGSFKERADVPLNQDPLSR
jgi:hypothetical protein